MNLTDLELSLPDKQTIKESLVSTSITKLTQELEQLPYGNMPEALDQDHHEHVPQLSNGRYGI